MAFINFGMANTLAQAKASANKNKLFFPTDSKKIVIDGKEYGGLDGVDITSKNSMYGVVGNGNNITDGVAAIRGIKGNTIAWNQLCKYDISAWNEIIAYTWRQFNYTSSFEKISNGIIVTSKTQSNGNADANYTIENLGHIYYCSLDIVNELDTAITCSFKINRSDVESFTVQPNTTVRKKRISVFNVLIGGYGVNFYNIGYNNSAKIINSLLFDLTLIYGAGNEPTSVEQFEADYKRWFGKPLTYEPYDAGSLRNVRMSGIKTVGFNQWDEEWTSGNGSNGDIDYTQPYHLVSKNFIPVIAGNTYYIKSDTATIGFYGYDKNKTKVGTVSLITLQNSTYTIPNGVSYVKFQRSGADLTYNHDICINLSWSGYRNGEYEPYWTETLPIPITTLTGKLNGQGASVVVFPDGMKGVGTAFDEGIVDNGYLTKVIKRFRKINLDDIDWQWSDAGFFLAYHQIADAKAVVNNSDIANIICSRYITATASDIYFNNIDKAIGFENSTSPNIRVRDSSAGTDAAAFKAAMGGVELVYELAEPEVYVLDEPIPMIYRVDDFGTEEILPACTEETPCCAPELDIRYRITPVEVLDNFKNVTNNKQVKAIADNARTENRLVTWGGDGSTVKDGGKTINDLLPVNLTISWDDNNKPIISGYSNFKNNPNAVVCNFLGNIMPMTFCHDHDWVKIIGMFVVTQDIAEAFLDKLQISLNMNTLCVLQIYANWDEEYLLDMNTISIRTMDGTYVYEGGGDSSGSGSEPYNEWEINGNTPDGSSISQLNNFNYVGEETVSMIACWPEGSSDPIFVTGSGAGEYPKDVIWDDNNNYWYVTGGLSVEGSYALKAYDSSYNVVSEIQIVIA